MNLNPYIIIMEDKSMFNIYSMLEKDKTYRFKLEECKFSYFYIHRVHAICGYDKRAALARRGKILSPPDMHVLDIE